MAWSNSIAAVSRRTREHLVSRETEPEHYVAMQSVGGNSRIFRVKLLQTTNYGFRFQDVCDEKYIKFADKNEYTNAADMI